MHGLTPIHVEKVMTRSGAVVAEFQYDAFGNAVSEYFAQGFALDAFPHCFSTKYRDQELGLYYYGYRYYFSELGRWLNRDPIEERGGINYYHFVHNNPLTFWDPLGHRAEYAIKEWVKSAWLDYWDTSAVADILPSVGFQGAVQSIGGSGLSGGLNVQFFPETCEIGFYKYYSTIIELVMDEDYRNLEMSAENVKLALRSLA